MSGQGEQLRILCLTVAGRAATDLVSDSVLCLFSGRLMARVSSRPGQCGRCDGYLLEGKELDFYMRKLRERRGK